MLIHSLAPLWGLLSFPPQLWGKQQSLALGGRK